MDISIHVRILLILTWTLLPTNLILFCSFGKTNGQKRKLRQKFSTKKKINIEHSERLSIHGEVDEEDDLASIASGLDQTSSTEKAQRQAVASDKTPGNNRQSTTEKTLPLITPDANASSVRTESLEMKPGDTAIKSREGVPDKQSRIQHIPCGDESRAKPTQDDATKGAGDKQPQTISKPGAHQPVKTHSVNKPKTKQDITSHAVRIDLLTPKIAQAKLPKTNKDETCEPQKTNETSTS